MVATGTGVSLTDGTGTGVPVGTLICATAVSKAAVITIFGSTVTGAGWQAANSPATRLKARI